MAKKPHSPGVQILRGVITMYKIIRFYYTSTNKRPKVIKKGLTLEEAQRHCSDPKTAKEGVYFDGYNEY